MPTRMKRNVEFLFEMNELLWMIVLHLYISNPCNSNVPCHELLFTSDGESHGSDFVSAKALGSFI